MQPNMTLKCLSMGYIHIFFVWTSVPCGPSNWLSKLKFFNFSHFFNFLLPKKHTLSFKNQSKLFFSDSIISTNHPDQKVEGQTNHTKVSLSASTAQCMDIMKFFLFFFFYITKFAYLFISKMQKKIQIFDVKPQKVTFSLIFIPFPIFSHFSHLLKNLWKLVENTYKP